MNWQRGLFLLIREAHKRSKMTEEELRNERLNDLETCSTIIACLVCCGIIIAGMFGS